MTATFHVPSLNCGACAQAVRVALGSAPAIRSVNVDIAGKTVLVDFDDARIALSGIETLLADADFPAASHEVQ